MGAPDTITCVECGGVARILTGFPEDDPPRSGDIVPYRCTECGERWDVELDPSDDEDEY